MVVLSLVFIIDDAEKVRRNNWIPPHALTDLGKGIFKVLGKRCFSPGCSDKSVEMVSVEGAVVPLAVRARGLCG